MILKVPSITKNYIRRELNGYIVFHTLECLLGYLGSNRNATVASLVGSRDYDLESTLSQNQEHNAHAYVNNDYERREKEIRTFLPYYHTWIDSYK